MMSEDDGSLWCLRMVMYAGEGRSVNDVKGCGESDVC